MLNPIKTFKVAILHMNRDGIKPQPKTFSAMFDSEASFWVPFVRECDFMLEMQHCAIFPTVYHQKHCYSHNCFH